jgi:hypothetical protein
MVPAFLLRRVRDLGAAPRGRMLTAALERLRAARLLDPAEIPGWSRPGAPRAAGVRRAVGGEARRTMRDYQQQAIELGFLHSRFLRGTAPPDFAAARPGATSTR